MSRRCLQFLLVAVFAVFFSFGCTGQDEVTRYSVPRTASSERTIEAMAHESSGEKSEPERMLAAIVPRGPTTWFFKVQGQDELVANEQQRFADFIASLRFSGEPDEPTWTLPNGWRRMPAAGMRFATLRIDSVDQPIELTVIPLSTGVNGLDDYILANVNRWRGQLSMPPVNSLDALRGESPASMLRETKLQDGTAVTLVNMLGRNASTMDPHSRMTSLLPPSHPPIFGGAFDGSADTPAPKPELKYEAVPEWKPGKAGGMRQAAFEVVDGDRRVEITVINLPSSGGDRLSNVNRWRQQMKLPPVNEADLAKSLSPIRVDGRNGDYVEIFGPDVGGKQDAILGVMVNDTAKTWFFKLSGSAELAKRETARFKKFVETVKLSQ